MDENVMRHEYRELTTPEQNQIVAIKDRGVEFYRLLVELGDSRELSLAKTRLEEAVMWATRHVTR